MRGSPSAVDRAGWVASLAIFAVLLFGRLAHPLMWQDEAETAVFAERILEYGFPKVHGERNVIYEFGTHAALGIDEATDAYIGTTWGHFYYAVPGVLWARSVDDPYAKTWRIRLPFALAGALGVALLAFAVTPVFAGDRARSLRFAAVYLLLSAGSISLLLHLREARYYALLVLAIGAIACVHLRHAVFATLSARAYGAAIAALLVLLFNVFYSAFFSVGLLLAVDLAWRELVTRHGEPAPLLRLARAWAPLALALALVAPELVYFETFQIAAAFSEHLGLSVEGYLANLRGLLRHLWVHELLAPALALRAATLAADRFAPPDEASRPSRRVNARLVAFSAGYAAIGCLNPLVYERYFVLLGPLLALVVLLDAFDAVARLRARGPGAARAAAAAVALLLVFGSIGRVADLRGRWRELRTPVRGPLDYAIPWIRDHYPHPENLVIATNYENHPYIYYLRSHVIVGLSRSNIRRDRLLDPDLVIPRRRWPVSLPDALAFLRRGDYEEIPFEVRDLHYNDVPALSRSASTPDPHRFETALARSDAERFSIFAKRRAGGAPLR